MEEVGEIGRLPEECVSHVLALTSPRDACRSAAVSAAFRCAADSDVVWKRFLPSDYGEILSRAVDPVVYASLKQLYFILCDSILIDGGRKVFALERESGAKCYTICARDLGISWGDAPRYWNWQSHPDSRFGEVAELKAVCWLEICGRIDCRELSPNTTYKAYLIFKLTPEQNGLKYPPQQVSVSLGAQISEQQACLHPDMEEVREVYLRRGTDIPPELRVPRARNDGWMEVEMGEFFNEDGGDGEVRMIFREVKAMNWKRGLVVEGIQVRPN